MRAWREGGGEGEGERARARREEEGEEREGKKRGSRAGRTLRLEMALHHDPILFKSRAFKCEPPPTHMPPTLAPNPVSSVLTPVQTARSKRAP